MNASNQTKKPTGSSEVQSPLTQLGRRFTLLLVAIAILLIVGELIIHRHGEFAFEDMLFFPALYGFLAFLFIVQVGKWLRRLIMRSEDYYDR